MNTTFVASVATLVAGVLFFVLAVALLGTPVTDIGMLSTAAVFILLGGLGLALNKVQTNPA
jgi:hypothetical protein